MKDTAVIAVLLLLASSNMLLSSRSIRACLVARFGGKMVPCGVFSVVALTFSAPIESSAPTTPNDTAQASHGDTTGAFSSTP